MRLPHVDDRVRLTQSVPNTALAPGQVGVVCSTWSGCDEPVFEVEFSSPGRDEVWRKLLTLQQITIDGEVSDGGAASSMAHESAMSHHAID